MSRLKSIPSRIAAMPSRLGYATGDEQGRDRHRLESQPWRAWYKTARWQTLRREVFKRDRYTCQRSGELCIGRGQEPNAPVANHKVPHRGDETLFWSPANIETVSKRVHDSLIQAEERRAERPTP